MKYNVNNKIELEVNEIFDFKDTAMKVVSDYPDYYTCDECSFQGTPECQKFECLAENRDDNTGVHFVKFNDENYENK